MQAPASICCVLFVGTFVMDVWATHQDHENRMELISPFLYSPKEGWINDPNGLVYVNGVYHLFYQHSPHSLSSNYICWGHATSRDMVRWIEQDEALLYDDKTNEEPFSGTAALDSANTSGLCSSRPPVVACYTSRYRNRTTLADGWEARQWTQAQSIAYSCDDGRTWTKYAGNPVIRRPPGRYVAEYSAFRDPSLRYDRRRSRWLMTTVLSDVHKVAWFVSADLLAWTFVGEFGTKRAPLQGVWECPAMDEFTVRNTGERKWVLLMSHYPGGVAGGSGMHYHVGQFNGTAFVADDDGHTDINWFDYGADCYAGNLWNNVPGNQKLASIWYYNWDYGQKMAAQYKGAIGSRLLSLEKIDGRYQLLQEPVTQLRQYVRKTFRLGKLQLLLGMLMFRNEAYRLRLAIRGANESDFAFAVEDETRNLVAKIRFSRDDRSVCVQRQSPDRDKKGQLENHCAHLATVGYETTIEILMDNYSMTVFFDRGLRVFTEVLLSVFKKRVFRLLPGFHKIKVEAFQHVLVKL